METLAEIENAIPALSDAELATLEHSVRKARHLKSKAKTVSAFDLPPLDLGKVLRPLAPDDDLLGEMLDDARF